MKKLKYTLGILLALIMIVSAMPIAIYADVIDTPLGYRSISYQISSSDLENYADGGRSGLDIYLRNTLPKDVNYSFETNERQVVLNIYFEFNSAEEYREKVIALCGTDTAVISSTEDEVLFVETATAMSYLDFLFVEQDNSDSDDKDNTDETKNPLSTFDIRSMMTVIKNTLYVNGNEYQIESNVNIRPTSNTEKPIMVDYISIQTDGKRNGSFKRTIKVGINNDENEERKDYFNKLFKKVGKVKTEQQTEYETTLQVSFETYGETELAKKTEQCLGCTVLQTETLYSIDKKNVGVTNQEFYDLSVILNPEGTFDYTFNLPSYYSNVQTVEGYSYLNEKCISASSEIITFSYEKRFFFDEISIVTDVSNVFGKIERTIQLGVSSEIADFYYENIKEQLVERLPKNSTLTIEEIENGIYYTVSYSSFSSKKISEFTDSILNNSGELTINRGFLGISNEISETISVDNILTSMSPTKNVSVDYKLISTASMSDDMEEYDDIFSFDDKTVKWTQTSNENISITYSGVNFIKITALIVFLFLISVLTFIVIKRINSHRSTENT